jgi:hypothetical protein
VLIAAAHLLWLAVLAAEPVGPTTGAASGAIPLRAGRTTTVVVVPELGSPLELAVPSAAYARAAAADADGRWEDALPLYRQAMAEWTALSRTRPSRPLALAIDKAQMELQISQLIAALSHDEGAAGRAAQGADDARRAFGRQRALQEGRLLEGKLLSTRAALGRVSPTLYARARDRLEEARDAEARPAGGAPARANAEIELLLCATYALGDADADARLARARVTEAERADPNNGQGLAGCAALLGETETALRTLESVVLRRFPPRLDRFLRDLYLSNEWDRLRGNPRFESLFPR